MNIMINQNMPIVKDSTTIKSFLAVSPPQSTSRFAWDNFRFVIEHHRTNQWTVVVENIEKQQCVEFEENISTFELAELLNAYLV